MRRECRACRGTGNAEGGLFCPDCGSTDIAVREPTAICRECRYKSDDIEGDFEVKERCPNCNGAGFVDPRDTDDAYEQMVDDQMGCV